MSEIETLVKELHELVLELREHNVHIERLVVKALDLRPADPASAKDGDPLKCSFCGKSQLQVEKLIAGPDVWICDECVELCAGILKEERTKAKKKS